MKRAILNWSGGKESALCLYHSLRDSDVEIKYLLTTMSEAHNRISMHGVRQELLHLQAESIGIELMEIFLPENTSLGIYDELMKQNMEALKKTGIDHSIFGDIFLEDLKKYREEKLAEVSMRGLFPLWGRDTKEIMKEFIELGFKTVVVCVNEKYLDKDFAGRIIDEQFLKDLPANVDPCGENGEYHTFVFDGPIFRKPVDFELGEIVYKQYTPSSNNEDDECFAKDSSKNYDTGFWYRDLVTK